jgi:hypothetical protein
MSEQTGTEHNETAGVNRLALLRIGDAAVVAGMAGLTAVDTVSTGTAQAAAGDALLIGELNDSDTSDTTLTSASTAGPTYVLESIATGLAPLRLEEKTTPDNVDSPGYGDLANFDGHLYYIQDQASLTGPGRAHRPARQTSPTPQARRLERPTAGGPHHRHQFGRVETGAVAASCNLALGPRSWPTG